MIIHFAYVFPPFNRGVVETQILGKTEVLASVAPARSLLVTSASIQAKLSHIADDDICTVIPAMSEAGHIDGSRVMRGLADELERFPGCPAVIWCRDYGPTNLAANCLRTSAPGVAIVMDVRGATFIGATFPHLSVLQRCSVVLREKLPEIRALRRADLVVCLSENQRNMILQAVGVPPETTTVIPISSPASWLAYNAEMREQVRLQLGCTPDNAVLVYAGSMNWMHAFGETVQFAEIMNSMVPTVLLCLTGDTEAVGQAIRDANADVPCHVMSVFPEQMGDRMSAADLGIAFRHPRSGAAWANPVRVGEFWLNGLPVALNPWVGDYGVAASYCMSHSALVVEDFRRQTLLRAAEEAVRQMDRWRRSRSAIAENAAALFSNAAMEPHYARAIEAAVQTISSGSPPDIANRL